MLDQTLTLPEDPDELRSELMRWMPPPNGINCAKMVLL